MEHDFQPKIFHSGEFSSRKTFTIFNGLQQGTVNSPIFLNIFTCDVLRSFDLNYSSEITNDNIPVNAIAFADDLILYAIDSWPSKIQIKL